MNTKQLKIQSLAVEKKLNILAENCLDTAKKLHRSNIVDDIMDLWRDLTVERSLGLQKYFQKASGRRAYVGYYFPMYVAKVALLLERLDRQGLFADLHNQPLKMLDLGSGTLTGVAALRIFFKGPLQAFAVDKSLAPMRLGLDALRQVQLLEPSDEVVLKQANILGPRSMMLPKWQPNFIFLGHVLNEISRDRSEFIESMLDVLEPNGFMLIVEPASQSTSRNLMSLRDRIHSFEGVEIVAPCTGAQKCPLLLTPTSWCFSELKWRRPRVFADIDRTIGFERDALKASFLLIRKRAAQKTISEERVVSGTMKSEGILRRYLCTKDGLRTLETSISSESYAPVNAIVRGELLDKDLLQRRDIKVKQES
jgi:ribosomal protein RSM22 (predicted rRNA methylase)